MFTLSHEDVVKTVECLMEKHGEKIKHCIGKDGFGHPHPREHTQELIRELKEYIYIYIYIS
jgi:metal-dependent hydrolase (beta-lactamase superfamily II)